MGYHLLSSVLELKLNVPCAPLVGLLESPRHSCLLLAKLILAASRFQHTNPTTSGYRWLKDFTPAIFAWNMLMHSKSSTCGAILLY